MNCISSCAVLVINVVVVFEVNVCMTREPNNILVSLKELLKAVSLGIKILVDGHSCAIVRSYLVVACTMFGFYSLFRRGNIGGSGK